LENVTFLIEILAVFASLMSIWHAHDYFTNTLPGELNPGDVSAIRWGITSAGLWVAFIVSFFLTGGA